MEIMTNVPFMATLRAGDGARRTLLAHSYNMILM